MNSLQIQTAALAQPMRELVETLAEHYPILNGKLPVTLEPGAPQGVLEVTRAGAGTLIRYDRPEQACRAIGTLLAGIDQCREQTSFTTFGIMLDCSRNAVMTVAHFKRWLRQLALFGYNMAMLYTEDTYTLPGEEYFGYLRGRYSAGELREVDAYASRLGIEMIGCIQTLGHLERVLRWPSYHDVKDTSSVLMVDEDKSYMLIGKMIAQYADCFRSRRIHIGMDETHDLGRGRFMDLHGAQRGYDLFSRHLDRVVTICGKHGLNPMLWSDMYFRMGSPTQAYDARCEVPEDVINQISSAVQLVYWDYYQREQSSYAEMIRKHRELGVEPLMASGVWTWGSLWYESGITENTVSPCVAACREAGVKELFFTMWGDDGACCEFDSALAGLAFAAEQAYAGKQVEMRFNAICGANYKAVIAAAEMNANPQPMLLLWDDPLLRIAWKNEVLKKIDVWDEAKRRYSRILRRLHPYRNTTAPVDIAHAVALLIFLHKKIEINTLLDAGKFSDVRVSPILRALERLHDSFRRQWFQRNKPHGFETIQIRLGGQRQRYLELATRLAELAEGKCATIPELEENPSTAFESTPSTWRELAAAGIL